MVMLQLQRSLLSVNTPFTIVANNSSSSSALRLRPFMTKYMVLQNCSGTQLSFASFGTVATHRKQVLVRKDRVISIMAAGHLNAGEAVHYHTSSIHGSRCGFPILSGLRVGISNNWAPIRLSSPNKDIYSKRFLSQVPKVVEKNENKGVKCGLSSGKFVPSRGFSKYWKNKKVLTQTNIGSSIPIVSASKGGDAITSTEQQFDNGLKDKKPGLPASPSLDNNSKKESKSKGKKKQQPRSKKKSSTGSKEVPIVENSESALHLQVSKSDKNLTQASKNNSTRKGVEAEAPETATAVILKSNKKKERSNRTEKSMKEVNASSQEPKPNGNFKLQGQKKLPQLYPPIGKSIVVVESLTKAKVIQGYLGDMYEVLPSYGHVRDLAARSGSVRPDDDFSMVWEVPSAAWTHLKSIKVALNGAKNLILASDPDREGEAIAWHIVEMLQQQDALHEDVTLARVVFHEITEASIKTALQYPREIDGNLVHAYLARRALDYLIGFNISPLLWRKLPGCQSAGRVQSAALSLICDKEMEIDEFKPEEYWSIGVEFSKTEPGSLSHSRAFSSHLSHSDSKKLTQFSISCVTEAKDFEQKIKSASFHVVGSKRNEMRKNPPTPYITSTLQQDAANKLHFTPTYTMKVAQKLYEGIQLSDGKAAGLITYIRTDGLHISDEAVKGIRALVIERYGMNFASDGERKYFKKVKNAQEAHEAIRPTDIWRLPSKLVGMLDEDCLKLYTLIWSRTVACQMQPATVAQIQIDIGNTSASIGFRSACSRVQFLGYQAAFEDMEASTIRYKDNEGDERNETFEILKSLKIGDSLCLGEVVLKQHHTQPPARYSEGSLVKKLEELGIGRPSTYASTLKVLKDRNYVTVKTRVLYPEFRGRMVSEFLSHHFTEVTDYSFTADMETELDNVSAGLTEWKGLLGDYWTRFSSYCKRVESVHIHQVEKMLEKKFGDFLFDSLPDKNRTCPSCSEGTLIFKVSRFGAGYFIGCDQHPKCKYIAKTLYGNDDEEISPQNNHTVEEPKLLGLNPDSKEKIFLKNGPYGFYVQLGEDRKGFTPKRASLSQIKDVDSITLENALELLRYPITLGDHPTEGGPVILKLAKAGFSLRHKRTIAPVPKNTKAGDMTLEKALELLSSKNVKRIGRPKNKPKMEIIETM